MSIFVYLVTFAYIHKDDPFPRCCMPYLSLFQLRLPFVLSPFAFFNVFIIVFACLFASFSFSLSFVFSYFSSLFISLLFSLFFFLFLFEKERKKQK